jgi:membrane-bound ClpP family serine protease
VKENFPVTAFGIALLLAGAALVIAEAHVPGGVLGVAGGIALIAGGIIVIAALGGGAALAVPVGIGIGTIAGAWTVVVTRKAAAARQTRVRAGAEGLCGQVGVVRRWTEPSGQVFVDGALWRARHDWPLPDTEALHEGDPVVVERVTGLTLCVRRADEWELTG